MGWVRADYQKIFGNIRTYALKYHKKLWDSQSLCEGITRSYKVFVKVGLQSFFL